MSYVNFANRFAFIAVLILLLLLAIISEPALNIKGNIEFGNPYCFHKDRLYLGEITQVMATESYLYLLYDDKQVLACYDLVGNYLCSYGLWFHENGEATLGTCKGDMAYLMDHRGNVYLFDGKDYVSFLEKNKHINEINELCCSPGGPLDSLSTIRWASVCRQNADGTWEKIIPRPYIFSIFQHIRVELLLCILILTVVFLINAVRKHRFRLQGS